MPDINPFEIFIPTIEPIALENGVSVVRQFNLDRDVRAAMTPGTEPGHWSPEMLEARHYIVSPGLGSAIGVMLVTGQPLLLTGDPGAGKTMAAYYIAWRLGLGEPLRFQVKSDSKARDLCYTYDTIGYFRDSQLTQKGEPKPDKSDPLYLTQGELWQAIQPKDERPKVLLVDEIDKAPRDFPNDLLREFERLTFTVQETREQITPQSDGLRPLIVVTSNSERRLPEPFLRRCIYYNLKLTDLSPDQYREAVRRHLGAGSELIGEEVIKAMTKLFLLLLETPDVRKKPSMNELRAWFLAYAAAPDDQKTATREKLSKVLGNAGAGGASDKQIIADLPFLETLIKTREDRESVSLWVN